MRRFTAQTAIGVLLAGVVVAALASGATAGAGSDVTTTTFAPPINGSVPVHNMAMYVDTVQGAGGSPAPAVGCSMSNEFIVGQVVVFRMWGVEIPSGGPSLVAANVKSATVTIPGVTAPIPFAYGTHGTVSYWTAAWPTTGYANLGIVHFLVTVVTNPIPATKAHAAIPSLTGHFSQNGMPAPSQLTINAS